MARNFNRPAKTDRIDVYEEVTNQIVAMLETGEPITDNEGEEAKRAYLKKYVVFNLEQIDGLDKVQAMQLLVDEARSSAVSTENMADIRKRAVQKAAVK